MSSASANSYHFKFLANISAKSTNANSRMVWISIHLKITFSIENEPNTAKLNLKIMVGFFFKERIGWPNPMNLFPDDIYLSKNVINDQIFNEKVNLKLLELKIKF